MVQELPLYRRFLGDGWEQLPPQIRALHDGDGVARGVASVERGSGVLASIAATIMGFPKAGTDVPVEVAFSTANGHETWTRRFGGKPFSSVQSEGRGRWAGLIRERFGPMSIGIAFAIEGERLRLVVRRWSAFGVTLPNFLAPGGDTFESVEDGRFHFHVEIGFRWTGLIVRYAGWLVRD